MCVVVQKALFQLKSINQEVTCLKRERLLYVSNEEKKGPKKKSNSLWQLRRGISLWEWEYSTHIYMVHIASYTRNNTYINGLKLYKGETRSDPVRWDKSLQNALLWLETYLLCEVEEEEKKHIQTTGSTLFSKRKEMREE